VNIYLHTVASVGFLFTLNYDARNHKLKTSRIVIKIHEANKLEHTSVMICCVSDCTVLWLHNEL